MLDRDGVGGPTRASSPSGASVDSIAFANACLGPQAHASKRLGFPYFFSWKILEKLAVRSAAMIARISPGS